MSFELEKLRVELRHIRGMYAMAQSETFDASRRVTSISLLTFGVKCVCFQNLTPIISYLYIDSKFNVVITKCSKKVYRWRQF